MKITIKTISHVNQSYDTVGDWKFTEQGDLEIKVSDMGNWKYEVLVGIHEMVESLLCKDRNISEPSVSDFDIEFESIRKLYPDVIGDEEPGNMISAPYNKEHLIATHIEKIMASELSVDWNDYDKTVNEL